MRARTVVVLLTVVLVVYFVLLGQRAVLLIGTGEPAAIGLGVGVLLLPLIGAVLLVYELRFGWRTQQLARRLAADDALPDDSGLARRPSGRIDRDAADAHFATVKAQLEQAPDDWRSWYRLAHAYDLSGDRRRARSSMRRAVELARASPGGPGG